MRPQRCQKRAREASGPHSALSASEGGMEESREKREERREKMAATSMHCIFTVSRDQFKKVMKIRGGHENDRQLDSLHFYGVP